MNTRTWDDDGPLRSGDLVTLKSGGPTMTVKRFVDEKWAVIVFGDGVKS